MQMLNAKTLKMSDKPVQWQTPDGVMRRIRLRKQQNHRRFSLSTPKHISKLNESTPENQRQPINPCNPFARKRPASAENNAIKKRILSSSVFENIPVESNASDSSNSSDAYANLFGKKSDVLDGESKFLPNRNTQMPFVYLEEDSIQGIFTEDKVDLDGGTAELPIDWTVKRKARFLSKASYAWCSRIKGGEEAASITNSARCREVDIGEKPPFGPTPEALQRQWRVELGRCLTYWQQPSIPWLTLYPRYGNQQKLHQSGAPPMPQTDEVTKSFYDSWTISFRSAYQLVRERLCPYFYICAQQYTAIFRAATMSGVDDITCMLTPSTTGLRQSLTKEGIKFTLPLQKATKPPTSPKNDENKENMVGGGGKEPTEGGETAVEPGGEVGDEEDGGMGEEDEATWEMISGKIQMNGVKELRQTTESDTSTKSVVLVKGNNNTQLLFNYLLNSRSSTTCSGAQANMPPTILSPVPFQGASLQKLTVRTGIAKTYTESSLNRNLPGVAQHKFSLDVAGPLLPHSIVGLTELLRKTQGAEGFEAALSSSMYTSPFNAFGAPPTADSKVASESDSSNSGQAKPALNCDFGVSNVCTSMLQSKKVEIEKNGCICQVTCKNGLFSWKI